MLFKLNGKGELRLKVEFRLLINIGRLSWIIQMGSLLSEESLKVGVEEKNKGQSQNEAT